MHIWSHEQNKNKGFSSFNCIFVCIKRSLSCLMRSSADSKKNAPFSTFINKKLLWLRWSAITALRWRFLIKNLWSCQQQTQKMKQKQDVLKVLSSNHWIADTMRSFNKFAVSARCFTEERLYVYLLLIEMFMITEKLIIIFLRFPRQCSFVFPKEISSALDNVLCACAYNRAQILLWEDTVGSAWIKTDKANVLQHFLHSRKIQQLNK